MANLKTNKFVCRQCNNSLVVWNGEDMIPCEHCGDAESIDSVVNTDFNPEEDIFQLDEDLLKIDKPEDNLDEWEESVDDD